MTVDTAGSDYDTVVGVYTGTPGAFTNVACNDDVGLVQFGHTTQAAATFDTVAGTTYWIQPVAWTRACRSRCRTGP